MDYAMDVTEYNIVTRIATGSQFNNLKWEKLKWVCTGNFNTVLVICSDKLKGFS